MRSAPAARNQVMPKNGWTKCQREISQGTYPATIPGAMTRKMAEPRLAEIRRMTVAFVFRSRE